MNLGKMKLVVPASLLTVALLAAACTETGETRNESERVDLDGATSATVLLRMGAGELDLAGGASGMLDADFTYNVEDWEPEVDWEVTDGKGRMEIDQSGSSSLSLFDLDGVLTATAVLHQCHRGDVRAHRSCPRRTGLSHKAQCLATAGAAFRRRRAS